MAGFTGLAGPVRLSEPMHHVQPVNKMVKAVAPGCTGGVVPSLGDTFAHKIYIVNGFTNAAPPALSQGRFDTSLNAIADALETHHLLELAAGGSIAREYRASGYLTVAQWNTLNGGSAAPATAFANGLIQQSRNDPALMAEKTGMTNLN